MLPRGLARNHAILGGEIQAHGMAALSVQAQFTLMSPQGQQSRCEFGVYQRSESQRGVIRPVPRHIAKGEERDRRQSSSLRPIDDRLDQHPS